MSANSFITGAIYELNKEIKELPISQTRTDYIQAIGILEAVSKLIENAGNVIDKITVDKEITNNEFIGKIAEVTNKESVGKLSALKDIGYSIQRVIDNNTTLSAVSEAIKK